MKQIEKESPRKKLDIERDPRWVSIVSRDRGADGVFYYAVKTTGIYCRPSCAARLAKSENIEFYSDYDEAERAGFRPCKRCKPRDISVAEQQLAVIKASCRLIECSDEISPKELAQAAQMSLYHFHRLFKELTGLTPKKYITAQRAARLRQVLCNKNISVTEAIYEAGFHSTSRFYETSDQLLGMTPRQYRAGGPKERIYFALGQCSLGAILVAQSKHGVCAILLGDEPERLLYDLQDYFPQAELIGADPHYESLIARVIGFIEKPAIGLDLPLDLRGTSFQQRVWQALRELPLGARLSYSELATRLNQPKATRAVARACASNKLAVAIPCHRVVRQDGSLSGYRWGVERKQTLLEREKAEKS